jgi:hypothetical protein
VERLRRAELPLQREQLVEKRGINGPNGPRVVITQEAVEASEGFDRVAAARRESH